MWCYQIYTTALITKDTFGLTTDYRWRVIQKTLTPIPFTPALCRYYRITLPDMTNPRWRGFNDTTGRIFKQKFSLLRDGDDRN